MIIVIILLSSALYFISLVKRSEPCEYWKIKYIYAYITDGPIAMCYNEPTSEVLPTQNNPIIVNPAYLELNRGDVNDIDVLVINYLNESANCSLSILDGKNNLCVPSLPESCEIHLIYNNEGYVYLGGNLNMYSVALAPNKDTPKNTYKYTAKMYCESIDNSDKVISFSTNFEVKIK